MIRIPAACVLAIGISFLILGRGLAQDLPLHELEVDHALTCEFPTPHTDWAQPYALGKTRVLFFCHGMGTAPRECVELIQRFDLDAQAVFWSQIVDSPQTHWHGGATGVNRMFKLVQEKWDCFVFFGLSLENMAPREQYLLLKAVTDGAGLVLVGSDDSRVLKAKNRLTELPPILAAGPVGEAFTVGRGRGLRLPKRPEIAYHEGWHVADDYWHERVGRAVLWAAGKEPKLQVEVQLAKAEFAPAEPKKLSVRLTGTPVGQQLALHASVRRPADEPIALPVREIAAGQTLDLELPRLPAGEYHADARVLGAAGVETWATVPFRVRAERIVAALDLDQDWGEIGEQIRGRVTLQGPPVAEEVVRVRLLDRRRRELVRHDYREPNTEAAFNFDILPWLPMLVTVEAQVLDAHGEVSRRSRYFHVTKRNRGQFNFLMWDIPTGPLAPYAEEALAATGVTLHLQNATDPPPYVAAWDIAWVPYTTRIMTPKSPQGIMPPFCWNDQAAVQKHVTELAARYVPARRHGVFAYSLGDENDTLGCCLSPHCLQAYRAYLREQYETLDALNRAWGTAFTGWDQVGLSQDGDNEEAAARAQGNFPRWFDRQAFKSANYVQYCQQYARAFAAIDPQAKTGFEGAGGFARGDDLDLIVRRLEFWSPYPGTADEVLRSLAPRAMPRANWMGYTKDADSLLQKYWRMVTRGSDAVWWWRWDCIGAFHGWLAPDLRPYPAVKEILADTQIMRDGLGDLLLQSQMQDDGIALLYSYPSVFAHQVGAGPGYGGYEEAHLRLQQTLRDLGLQFRYVSDRMLRLGAFDAARFKVLILCRSEALGDREVEVIRRFVAGGGTVIADLRPGLYDDHCRPRATGVLDDLFGITCDPKAAAKKVTMVTTAGPNPQPVLPAVVTDPSVKLTDTGAETRLTTAEGVPVGIVRPLGKGRAVLLNIAASGLPKPGSADTPEGTDRFFRELLEQSGVRAAVRVRTEAGGRLPNVEVVRWANGGLEIVALFRQEGKPEPALVELTAPQSRWVYDLRNRKVTGPVTQFVTPVIPNRATFVVLASQAVPPPQLVPTRTTVHRGEVLQATLAVPNAEGRHALRLRVRTGDRPLPWFDQTVIAGPQPKPIVVPIAHNDPAGRYEITATDVFTATASPAVVQVDP